MVFDEPLGMARRGRQIAREAARVFDTVASNGDTASLVDALSLARANLRRASNLGRFDGGDAREPALVALACAAASVLGEAPTLQQLQAALALHAGYAVELGFTGGRALPLALAAMLHAWSGRHCHIVCADNHAAARDAGLLAPLYRLCGVTVAALASAMPPAEAESCYALDIVYATGRQLLSDFMRDDLLLAGAVSPMRRSLQARKLAAQEQRPVTRGFGVAIVADIESVLVDEAASPVLISAAGNATVLDEATVAACSLIEGLLAGRDYRIVASPGWHVDFSEEGLQRLADLGLSLPVYWQHPQRRYDLVSNALLARDAMVPDYHYVVQEGSVMLADDSALRLLAGRVWHNGILQALEARNGLPLSTPPRTVARAALQTFFPRYAQLAGAGSSLAGLHEELAACYGLDVMKLAAPTLPSPQRRYAYADRAARFDAFIAHIERLHDGGMGVPVLVGAPRTADLAAIGRALVERAVPFQVIDGRDPEKDAASLAAADTPGAVTFVTGWAARNGVPPAPGSALHVLLFEHWDARRGDEGFFAWSPFSIVFGSTSDDILQRPLPAWAGWLRAVAKRVDAGGAFGTRLLQALVALSQWYGSRHGSRYRRTLALRETQLDEQLAFSSKA